MADAPRLRPSLRMTLIMSLLGAAGYFLFTLTPRGMGIAAVLAVGYLLPLIYLGWSLFLGKRASPNPWHARGLEWKTASPPPKENFHETPEVDAVPYAYNPEEKLA